MSRTAFYLIFSFSLCCFATHAAQENHVPELPQQSWSFQGPLGTFDRKALQNGFKVYKEVCAACHNIKFISFRNLTALGYNRDEIKAIASEFEVTAGPNDEGEMFQRKATFSDYFPSPYPNEKAARAANSGAFPPDLSLIVKARNGGADYLYALLTGYEHAPPINIQLSDGMSYNPYFPGGQIAMPPPLTEGLVTYSDGSTPSVNQMSKDVTTFLAWAAEPELEVRKEIGFKILIYLLVFTSLMYIIMKRIWKNVH